MSRQYIIASHAHFAEGIFESVKLLAGDRDDVSVLNAFVDGNDDVEAASRSLVESMPDDTDVVVLTDLMGGSVNNEFTRLMLARPNVYLVTNMNLPLLLTLFLSDEDEDTESLLRQIVSSDEVRPRFVNDDSAIEEDEDF